MSTNYDPLTASPPAEIPLPDAPLVRVIAQVRFPLDLSVEDRRLIRSLQDHLREEYPFMSDDRRGEEGNRSSPIWRFRNAEDSWGVSLGGDFMALETSAYQSRQDFLARLERFLRVVSDSFPFRFSERLGIRYIDRIEGADTATIRQLIRPEMAGLVGTKAAAQINHAINEVLFEVLFNVPDEKAKLRARSAYLPSGMTIDPAAIEPVATDSWLLDLDMFRVERRPFDVAELMSEAQHFAERIYTFFRWTVTDEFLQCYGGKL